MNNKFKTNSGLSLVEMLIAIAIFVIGMVAFTLLFTRGWKSNTFIMEEGQASMAASRGVDSIVGELRRARQGDNGSYPVESADDNDLVVYMDIDHDDATERVHYFLDETNKKVKRGVAEPIAGNPITYPSGDSTVEDVVSYVANSSSEPIFYYYGTGYPASPDAIAVPVNASQLQDIRLVRVKLLVNLKPGSAPDNIIFESRNINNYVY
jgi:prepilin-type N-terminal cleavage/methylation domain-containing protein